MATQTSSDEERSSPSKRQRRSSRLQSRARQSLEFLASKDPDSESSEEEQIEEDWEPEPRGKQKGKGKATKQSVGKKSTKRGKHKFHGTVFDEGEVERLQRLHQERTEKANEIVEELTDEQRKELLLSVVVRDPGLILDAHRILSLEGQPPEPEPDQPGVGPSWCVCSHCPDMPREEDRSCCMMAPTHCNSLRPEMGLIVLDELTLRLQQYFRDDMLALNAANESDANKSFRHAAYRQYVLWVHGQLAQGDRRKIPACCVRMIRDKYPSPSGEYTGFRQGGIGM